MSFLRLSLIASVASTFALPSANAQTVTTDPVGFVTVGITAGTGTAKCNTLFSVPLLEAEFIGGQVAGTITGVTANTISNSNAGWTAGALSQPETPYLIQITSGAAEGRIFLIASSASTGGAIGGTANTATTATVSSVDASQVDLTFLGIVVGTDTYRISACDTLISFFGTPATTGVQGGMAAANADTIIIISDGSAKTYFYSTTANRWSQVSLGTPDASDVPLIPYYGIQYARLPATSLDFTVTGAVPTESRKVSIKNSGPTLLSEYWPAESTLLGLGLQNLPGGLSGAAASSADTVLLISGGTASTFWYNGGNGKKVNLGSPTSDTTPIPIGASIMINRRGTAAGYTPLAQSVPYNLNCLRRFTAKPNTP
jgi:hypothetical protein